MSKFTKSIKLFIAGLPLLDSQAYAGTAGEVAARDMSIDYNPVSLRPLNFPADNLFAGHRSHSSHASHRSHASHASHYSGSGGGTSYTPVAPQSPPPPTQYYSPPVVATQPPAGMTGLTLEEKRQTQILRVQMALMRANIYKGHLTGTMDQETQDALRSFQKLKGMIPSGLMSTETLNALAVPAVQ